MAVSQKEIEFNFNEDKMRLKIRLLEKELEKVQLGGGKKKIDKVSLFPKKIFFYQYSYADPYVNPIMCT